jgi:hypothetical protein
MRIAQGVSLYANCVSRASRAPSDVRAQFMISLEKALINGDSTRTFSDPQRKLAYAEVMRFSAFDLDTVKLLMNLFVSPLVHFSQRVVYSMSSQIVRT